MMRPMIKELSCLWCSIPLDPCPHIFVKPCDTMFRIMQGVKRRDKNGAGGCMKDNGAGASFVRSRNREGNLC